MFKWNTETDGEEVFNIDKAINENWDKLDNHAKEVDNKISNIKAEDIAFTDGETFQEKYDSEKLKGEDGFSPTIIQKRNTDTEYVLTVTNKEGSFDTPNLKTSAKIHNTIFGVQRKLDNSSTKWERINDSVGLVANATHDGTEVQNDFDNIYPWSGIITCDVSANGTVNSYYGEPNFSFTNPVGYIMTYVPEFWFKRTQDYVSGKGTIEKIYITDIEQEGFSKSEAFYISRYTAGGTTSALSSKSGETSLGDTKPAQFRTSAKSIGNGWGLFDIWKLSAIQMLYLVEYADYNSQEILGYGNVNSTNKLQTGNCDSLGMKSGTLNNDKTHAVIYRGIENIFGNSNQFIDGLNIKVERTAHIVLELL